MIASGRWKLVPALLLSLTICGCCKRLPSMSSSGGSVEVLETHVDQRLIKADRGGALAVQMPEGAVAQVVIPGRALRADTELELVALASAPDKDKRTLAPGFVLRKKGEKGVGAHLSLAAPTLVTVFVTGSLPKNAGLVRYADDGGSYTPLKTTAQTDGKVTRLRARVDGFSALGVRDLDDAERKAADEADAKLPPFSYVIKVDDTITKDVQIWKIDYHLTMTATAPLSSDTWTGPATMAVKGKATSSAHGAFARVKIDGTYHGEAKFTMFPTLAPLVPPKGGEPNPRLAPLAPSSEYGFAMGHGTVKMKGTGTWDAFGTAGGVAINKADSAAGNETVPITVGMKVEEGDVRVVVQGVGIYNAQLFALPSMTPPK